MELLKCYSPPYPLNQYIKCYWIIKGTKNITNYQKTILPYSEVCMKFLISDNKHNKMNTLDSFTTGIYVSPPMMNHYSINLNSDFYYVDLTFFPGVFYELFKIPISNLENKIYKIEELSLNIDSSILEKLYDAMNNEDKTIKLLNDYFSTHIKKIKSDSLVMNIKDLYFNHNLDKFYRENKLSMRQIQRKVKEYTGLSPRSIQRISRFNKILSSLDYYARNTSNIAQDLNFFDQSHLIKDFKTFSGVSPNLFISNKKDFLY